MSHRQTAIDFLNKNFEPWHFEGDEPVVTKLAELLANAAEQGARMGVKAFDVIRALEEHEDTKDIPR